MFIVADLVSLSLTCYIFIFSWIRRRVCDASTTLHELQVTWDTNGWGVTFHTHFPGCQTHLTATATFLQIEQASLSFAADDIFKMLFLK